MNVITKYLGQVKTELKQVSWPSREQTKQKTILVVVVSLVLALFIGASDFVFQELIKFIIK